jgi:hypothetical protein
MCDTGHPLVQWHSPWEWPGFELIDNTCVSLVDAFKRHLYVYDMLFDGDKEQFEPSALSVNGSALVTKLEKVVDRLGNNDGKVSAQELGRAQRVRWVAQALSHLVVRYESEWGGDLSKWDSLSALMKERKYIWQSELERIEKLRWWDKVHGVAGLPGDAAVYHFHPVGLVGNFAVPSDDIDALIRKIGDIIAGGEGGYESYNSGTKDVPGGRVGHSFPHPPAGTVTNKTINDILGTESLSGTDPNRFFATGKYQTTFGTLRAAKNALGLTGTEKYDADMQERVFRDFLISDAGGGGLARFVKSGYGTVYDAQLATAKCWASIAAPKGAKIQSGETSDGTMSYYKGAANRAAMASTNKLIDLLQEIGQQRGIR